MVDAREQDADALQESDDEWPLWRRLGDQLGQRNARVTLGAHAPPVLLDRFEVRRRVGAGGRGVVFEGFDPALGRRVALKICQTSSAAAATEIEHEARSLAKLAHPNIVAVYDCVRAGIDVVLVMEFIEGQTLRDWQAATKPSWRDLLDRYVDAGRALAAVHAAGLEHGDFKPENVMIDHEGRVRVVDFGIARYSVAASEGTEASEKANLGTLPYMAPERLIERPGGPRADVYAFCVSVWESLYGVRPYEGRTLHALLESSLSGELAMGNVAVSVPEAVRVVLARGLRARASERPQSMDELLRALGDACETASNRQARRLRWGVSGLVMGLAFACASMAAMLMRTPEQAAAVLSPAPLPDPQPDAVEQTLTLAVEAARAGHPDSTLTYLELARSRAGVDGDEVALLEVAEQAEALGDEFNLRGEKLHARTCWHIAADILVHLPDAAASAELLRIKAKVRNR